MYMSFPLRCNNAIDINLFPRSSVIKSNLHECTCGVFMFASEHCYQDCNAESIVLIIVKMIIIIIWWWLYTWSSWWQSYSWKDNKKDFILQRLVFSVLTYKNANDKTINSCKRKKYVVVAKATFYIVATTNELTKASRFCHSICMNLKRLANERNVVDGRDFAKFAFILDILFCNSP